MLEASETQPVTEEHKAAFARWMKKNAANRKAVELMQKTDDVMSGFENLVKGRK